MLIKDIEFQALIPPLSADEYTQLEKNILKDGIRDPLVVWPQQNGDAVLLDGHNRLAISEAHHNITYQTVSKDFPDRDAAKLWIISNQLGRRNLPKFDRVTLEDKKREILARQAKAEQGRRTDLENIPKKSWESPREKRKADRENETDYKIAKAADTSEDTVRKVRAINEKATDRTKQLVREGKLSINQAYNSVHPKKPDPIKQAVKQAVQEHEEFQEKKKETVVDFQSVQADKANQEIISVALVADICKMLDGIEKFSLLHKTSEIDELVVDEKDRDWLIGRLDACQMTLQFIKERIEG